MMTATTAAVTGCRLDQDEARVSAARRKLIMLGAALVDQPFDTATHQRLVQLLTGEHLQGALAALDVLRQRPEQELRDRIAELSGHGLRLRRSA
ncbi:hypothetical protein ACFXPZ_17980 [Streptomyces sp. NPDC059101]|uniref:hypothetical protein n=1 Tax=Streptomyces sp. NPDC059101 TaxID=3346728 RepID=UPI0036D04B2E